MKLVDEIITLASSDSGSVSTLLRKCLVLAHTLRNDRLKHWAESELNGYHGEEDIPDYRKTSAAAKGLFLGPMGSYLQDQPIPPGALKEEHRAWAESAALNQPIAAYENAPRESNFVLEWPANLTVVYQKTFFNGRYVLNRAWLEIPSSVVIGFVDTIKTRVLRFALELREELAEAKDDPSELPKERVDQNVITYIFGGTNAIGSRDFVQQGNIHIHTGEWKALADALKQHLGVPAPGISELKSSLDEDAKDAPPPSLGTRTANWLKTLGKATGKTALHVAADIAQKEATKWVLGYLGLPS
jgi:hypothetical protein